MRAVQSTSDGVVRLVETAEPTAGPGEVLVAVAATALNRADLLQVNGQYPPPAGESEVPGLECAGTVAALGAGVEGWRVGDRVMALLAGGGQAERVAVPVGQLMAVPEGLSLVEAAAIPEAGITAWLNLAGEGSLTSGESVLVTAAASGVGAMVVQMARELGARQVVVAGRNADRLAQLVPLGATDAVVLGAAFADRVRAVTAGRGVDLVFEMVGGAQVGDSLAALAPRGRLVLIGLLGGRRAELDLSLVLRQRLRIVGSVLRPRSRVEKAAIVADFSAFALPRLADRRLRPVIDRVLPFDGIADGYAAMASSTTLGKVVVAIGD
jgi:putative PIG3 family NAD(P)H quinone oxidoreductase